MRALRGHAAPLALAGVAVALALGAAAAVLRAGDPPPRTEPADDAAAVAAGRAFLARYVARDGRVIRRDQGSDTVSEGQAYALLIAAALRDRERFLRVWRWTRAHLRRPDGLFAWHWEDGRVADHEPAADADLDVARAMLVAAGAFGDPGYARRAVRIGDAVRRRETVEAERGRQVLVAGPWARARRMVNPSYFAPRTLGLLWRASGEGQYRSLARSVRVTAGDLLAISPYRPPDWATVGAAGRAAPAAAPGRAGEPPAYGVDAQRLPVRFAESCTADDRALAGRLWPVLRDDAEAGRLSLRYTVDGRAEGRAAPVGWVGAAAAAGAAGDRAARDRLLDRAQSAERAAPGYYGAAWVALGRIMLQTGRLQGCALAAQRG